MKVHGREILQKAMERINSAPRGDRGAAVERVAGNLNMSPRHLRRLIEREFGGGAEPRRSEPGSGGDIVKYVEKVASRRAQFGAEEKRKAPLWQVIKICEDAGDIPRGALTEAKCYRIMKKLGIGDRKRCVRIEPEHIGRVQHTDGSGSVHWYIHRLLPDGDAVLRPRLSHEKVELHRRERVPKRRNDKTDRKRPLVYYYAAVDGHTRYTEIDCYIAHGENEHDHIDFLNRHWQTAPGKLWRGVPEEVISDNGPFARGGFGFSMCQNLGIELTTTRAYHSRENGKVERAWRTLWESFEFPMMYKYKDILFSEFKRELADYLKMYNSRGASPSIYAGGRTRERMAIDGFAEREARLIPEGMTLLELATVQHEAVIDLAGRFRRDNQYWEVADCPATMLRQKALLKFGLDGTVSAQNPHTGEWLVARPYKPLGQGDYRAFKQDANDAAAAGVEGLRPVEKLPFNDAGARHGADGPGAEKIVDLGDRDRKADPGGFRSYDEALVYFAEVFGRPVHELPESIQEKLVPVIREKLDDRETIDSLARALREADAG